MSSPLQKGPSTPKTQGRFVELPNDTNSNPSSPGTPIENRYSFSKSADCEFIASGIKVTFDLRLDLQTEELSKIDENGFQKIIEGIDNYINNISFAKASDQTAVDYLKGLFLTFCEGEDSDAAKVFVTINNLEIDDQDVTDKSIKEIEEHYKNQLKLIFDESKKYYAERKQSLIEAREVQQGRTILYNLDQNNLFAVKGASKNFIDQASNLQNKLKNKFDPNVKVQSQVLHEEYHRLLLEAISSQFIKTLGLKKEEELLIEKFFNNKFKKINDPKFCERIVKLFDKLFDGNFKEKKSLKGFDADFDDLRLDQ